MTINILFSSSSGNCTIINYKDTNIMIDAGVSYKDIKKSHPKDLNLNALFITHEHSDHISRAGVVARAENCPVYLPLKSYEAKIDLFKNCEIYNIEGGESVIINDLEIKAFSTMHDSLASVGYIITEIDTKKKFAFLTDTGGITKVIKEALFGCNAYFIESDYDEDELEKYADYDDFLKDRIRSPYGHLSNQNTVSFINNNIDLINTNFIILGHLSKNTNSPDILKSRIEYTIPKNHWSRIHIADKPIKLEL